MGCRVVVGILECASLWAMISTSFPFFGTRRSLGTAKPLPWAVLAKQFAKQTKLAKQTKFEPSLFCVWLEAAQGCESKAAHVVCVCGRAL